MSKISYCSLEEAWGPSVNKNLENKNKSEHNNSEKNKNNKDFEEINTLDSKVKDDYEILKKDNEDLKKMLNTMNYIERNKSPENNINENYNKYRFNPINKVNSLYSRGDDYKPFEDDIEKKSLQDRFIALENEFRKYKTLMNTRNQSSDEESIEGFNNMNNDENNTDIQDLIVLIVLGLIVIFIMDNIFKLGKYLGNKK